MAATHKRGRGQRGYLPGTQCILCVDHGGNNVYYAWLRTVSATGVAPLARGTARATSPTPASPLPPSPPLFHSSASNTNLRLLLPAVRYMRLSQERR